MNKQIIRCENCIHNEVCYLQEVCNNIVEQLDEFGCENFADKSLYIKLPCKVGDTVYQIKKLRQQEMYRRGYVPDEEWHRKRGAPSRYYKNVLVEIIETTMKKSFYAKLGKTIFLTKESAEQELNNMVKRNKVIERE